MLEDVWVGPFHQFHVVVCQLKRSLLKPHVPRGWGKDKGVVNVDDMPVGVDEDVVVMPIFDWEQVLDQAIPGKALGEIGHSGLPVESEDLFVDILQWLLTGFLLEVADCTCVINELNQATVIVERNDVIRPYPKFQVLFYSYLVDDPDQLHGHILLSKVISRLNHKRSNLVAGNLTVRRVKFYLVYVLFPFHSEIRLWQNQRLLFQRLLLILLATFYPLFQYPSILQTYRLKNQFKRHPFLRGKSKALVLNYSH